MANDAPQAALLCKTHEPKGKKKKMKRERPRETEDERWGELNYARVENKCETKWKIDKLIKAPTRN